MVSFSESRLGFCLTPLDSQKCFLKNRACPKLLAAYRCGSVFPQDGLASRQDREKVGITLVDWEREECPLRTDSAS